MIRSSVRFGLCLPSCWLVMQKLQHDTSLASLRQSGYNFSTNGWGTIAYACFAFDVVQKFSQVSVVADRKAAFVVLFGSDVGRVAIEKRVERVVGFYNLAEVPVFNL